MKPVGLTTMTSDKLFFAVTERSRFSAECSALPVRAFNTKQDALMRALRVWTSGRDGLVCTIATWSVKAIERHYGCAGD